MRSTRKDDDMSIKITPADVGREVKLRNGTKAKIVSVEIPRFFGNSKYPVQIDHEAWPYLWGYTYGGRIYSPHVNIMDVVGFVGDGSQAATVEANGPIQHIKSVKEDMRSQTVLVYAICAISGAITVLVLFAGVSYLSGLL